ncbi:NUDIX domain-containing protein [Halorussus sp. MSC15.2]|uniref:NUDIX domain-containing protein n=1 Tax=Halorussus sp. MSC15.2 TaxID=2283638 RepID=UPI0013D0862B|nr:NUDIX domain-containing protein [Halorussus sp. MSC15.2]NEU57562.1 NUDIX domain-containing protein [Halorussus sp. MSC15.2]
MTIPERSRRRVESALDRLRREYDAVEVVEKTWKHPPAAYDRVRERFEAGTLGGAGIWTTDDDGRVLLVRHEDESAWSDPGGKQEPGETLEDAARRETREETGVEAEITGVRQAHRIEIRSIENQRADDGAEQRGNTRPDRPPVHRLIVIFDGEYVSGEVRPREGEIAEVRWWRERPKELLYPELAGFPIPAPE